MERNVVDHTTYYESHFRLPSSPEGENIHPQRETIMNDNATSTPLRDRISGLKPKHWAMIAVGALLVFFALGSGGATVDPESWTCENIKDEIVEMSQDEDLQILEIGDVRFENDLPYGTLSCRASAEWSRGYGSIEYGGHVSDGGNVILQYRQM